MTVVQERAGAELAPPRRAVLSDRARHERRLGWILSAPAVVVMLFVTAYPMLNVTSGRCVRHPSSSRFAISSAVSEGVEGLMRMNSSPP